MITRQLLAHALQIPRGAHSILIQWMIVPILGNLCGLLFLVLVPLRRTRGGAMLPELKGFFCISFAYTFYITLRSLAAGANASEPIGDSLPLILVAGLSLWAMREPSRLDMHWLFRGLTVMLLAVFILTSFERVVLGVWRPELLMGNPLNLTPLLLVPCMIVTIREFAPSRNWILLGLLSFCLGGYVIGGLSQSRGLFLGLGILILLRLLFEFFSPAAQRPKLITCLAMLTAMLGLATAVAFNPAISGRYAVAAKTLSEPARDPEWSTDLRMTMLREGWQAFLERPLVGYGPQNRFEAVFPETSSFPARLSHLHNDFLTHGVGGGIVAIVLLCLILLAPAWAGCRNNAQLTPAIAHMRRQIGVLTSCAFFGVAMVNNVFFVSISAFTTALSLVSVLLILAALRVSDQATDEQR